MKPQLSLLEAKQKIEAFCAYQERCDQEVRKKLQQWHLYAEDIDILIADLIQHNFLNEERFAQAYVSGKFRLKRWGRIKIKQHLKQKNISDYSINSGMQQIEMSEYMDTLTELAQNKNRLITAKSDWERRQKLYRYLAGKGYETNLITEVLEELNLTED